MWDNIVYCAFYYHFEGTFNYFNVPELPSTLYDKQDMDESIARRKEKSDIRELRRVYNGYKDYIIRHTGTDDFANR